MDEPRARWTEGEADVRDRAREGDPTGEEFAAEIAPATAPPREKRAVDRAEQTDGSGWAIAGIILSVISLFVLPFLFAPAGVIVGYVAYRQARARSPGGPSASVWSRCWARSCFAPSSCSFGSLAREGSLRGKPGGFRVGQRRASRIWRG